METLPNEIIDHILNFLFIKELCLSRSLSKSFKEIVDRNQFYKFCKRILFGKIKPTKGIPISCVYGLMRNLDYFKRIYSGSQQIFTRGHHDTFVEACRKGHFRLAVWLSEYEPISNTKELERAFSCACSENHMEIVLWLKNKYPFIDIDDECRPFQHACGAGHILVAKYLVQTFTKINDWLSCNGHIVFKCACLGNHLEVAKWLKVICPTIDHKINFEEFFVYLCVDNCLDTIKWLKEIHPTIKMRPDAFGKACTNGNLEIARWIWETSRDEENYIDIRLDDDFIFRYVCEIGYLEGAKWLTIICSNYVIQQESPEIVYKIEI